MGCSYLGGGLFGGILVTFAYKAGTACTGWDTTWYMFGGGSGAAW